MINNSALSSSMNVADIAPKAATKQAEARQGDNAFGEALAGAHSVHDRRESQAATNSRRDWAQGDRSTERTRGQDRAREVRSDAADRTDRGDRPNTDVTATADDADATTTTDATATTATDTSAPTATDQSGDTEATTTDVDTSSDDAAAAQATVAVAAAPVPTDLDAIIVPTSTTVTQVTSDAVDAAVRLAIDTEAAATTTATAATTVQVDATATVATTADVEVDTDAQVASTITTAAPVTEDAEASDVQAGPKSPSTSTQATTSGPSPVQLAAATFTADDAATPTVQVTQQVAAADAVDVAAGTTTDAAATQLVQAAAVEVDTDADAAVMVDADATAEVVLDETGTPTKATKADAPVTQVAADAEVEVVDVDEPEVAQAARLNQTQAPTVAVNAQVQAKAAEQAAEEGSDAAAPAKLEPLPTQAAPIATAARGEGAAAALRMREGLQAQVQERIDHIAEQLATRLRLSQAAGGSHVQLSLKPRELGEVTVQMNVRDGAVAATILVDKADTLRTLQTNIEDLKRSLESQGLSIQEFSVDVRGDSGAGGANARAAADLRGNASRTSSGSTSSVAGAAAVTPGLSGDREVDPEDVHDGDVSVLA